MVWFPDLIDKSNAPYTLKGRISPQGNVRRIKILIKLPEFRLQQFKAWLNEYYKKPTAGLCQQQ